MATQIYVNLPVRDLVRSKVFFEALGYRFDPRFSDDKGAGMVIDDGHVYAMLLTEPFFQTFTKKEIADATRTTEVLNALSCESKAAVDEILAKGLAAGGTEPREPQDMGFMYGRALQDLDGHVWEYMWMDMAAFEKESTKKA
jgi:predicted lactoylglutathione lyase